MNTYNPCRHLNSSSSNWKALLAASIIVDDLMVTVMRKAANEQILTTEDRDETVNASEMHWVDFLR